MSLKKDKLIKYSLILGIIISLVFLKINHKNLPSVISDSSNIKAAIIPHHLLAQKLIEDLGEKISSHKKIKKIFIIGPNHNEVGKGPILTENNQFKNNHIVEDKQTLLNDHSCWVPKSILKEYLLNVEINCILIGSKADIQYLQEIAKEISVNSQENLLVISTDFSHYLNKNQADENDLITQELINKKDVDSVLKLDNGFVDSLKSLAFLFFYLKEINSSSQKIINHLNSSQILNQPNLTSTTSYFEILFF